MGALSHDGTLDCKEVFSNLPGSKYARGLELDWHAVKVVILGHVHLGPKSFSSIDTIPFNTSLQHYSSSLQSRAT